MPARISCSYLQPHVGRVLVPVQCRTLLSLDGCVSGEKQPGSCSPTLPSPVLPRVRTYLSEPRDRCGHRPRSSFPGSGRFPRRPAAGPGLRPCLWADQSRGAGHDCTQSARGRRRSPAGPAPEAAASLGPRFWAGRGRREFVRASRSKEGPPVSLPEVRQWV